MHFVFSLIGRLLSPLWHTAKTRPWLSSAVLGAASAVCFLLEIPYIRVVLALTACSVLIAKSEADKRGETVPASGRKLEPVGQR